MTTEQREPLYASTAKPWLKYYDQKFIDLPLPECSAFEYVCRQNKNHLPDTALEYYGRKITFAEGIHEYIEEVSSRLLICLNVTYERCHQAAKRTSVERVLVISPADSLPLHLAIGYKMTNPDRNSYKSNVLHWKDFIAAGKNQSMNAEPYAPQHTCVVVHTGGTTGSPKGVMLTDHNFNALAHEFAAQSRLFHRGQKLMNIMPPFIAYGYACGVHMPLVMGLHVIIIPNLDPDKLGALIWKHKPEHMFGVPAHYQQMAASLLLKNKDLSFIRNYAAGGDSLPLGAEQTVNEFLKEHGVEYPLAKGYGMTEVSSAATIAAGNVTKPGSVGIPMLNTVVSVFEPGTETELPIGERGEICICTPTAMKGYYNKPDETAMVLRRHADGQLWVHTGDLGYMDEDGFVYLDARIKRMIIRHDGFKVFPSMIENVISRHPAVHQCSVVGCTDKDHVQGRLPFVYVVLDPEGDKKKRQIVRELRQLCKEELPEYVQPVGYKFISEMPLTPVGKVDYRKLEEEITSRDY